MKRITTGIGKLDEMKNGGFAVGGVTVIASLAKNEREALMLNAVRHITEDLGKNVLLVTGGEPFEGWAWKIAEMYAPDDVNSRIRKEIALGISDREDTMETLEWLLKVKERGICFDDDLRFPEKSKYDPEELSWVRDRLHAISEQRNIKAIFIRDLSGKSCRGMRTETDYYDLLYMLRDLAQSDGIAVVVIADLKKEVWLRGDRHSTAADLVHSEDFIKCSDKIINIFNENSELPFPYTVTRVEVLVEDVVPGMTPEDPWQVQSEGRHDMIELYYNEDTFVLTDEEPAEGEMDDE